MAFIFVFSRKKSDCILNFILGIFFVGLCIFEVATIDILNWSILNSFKDVGYSNIILQWLIQKYIRFSIKKFMLRGIKTGTLICNKT